MLETLEQRTGRQGGATVVIDRGMAFDDNLAQIRAAPLPRRRPAFPGLMAPVEWGGPSAPPALLWPPAPPKGSKGCARPDRRGAAEDTAGRVTPADEPAAARASALDELELDELPVDEESSRTGSGRIFQNCMTSAPMIISSERWRATMNWWRIETPFSSKISPTIPLVLSFPLPSPSWNVHGVRARRGRATFTAMSRRMGDFDAPVSNRAWTTAAPRYETISMSSCGGVDARPRAHDGPLRTRHATAGRNATGVPPRLRAIRRTSGPAAESPEHRPGPARRTGRGRGSPCWCRR